MGTVQSSTKTETQWKPNDAWLIGIVLAVINFRNFSWALSARILPLGAAIHSSIFGRNASVTRPRYRRPGKSRRDQHCLPAQW